MLQKVISENRAMHAGHTCIVLINGAGIIIQDHHFCSVFNKSLEK